MTIEGVTHPLARPFIVLATQNPIEYEGTYPLPEAQLDRFLLRIGIGYPSREDEWRVLERARRAAGRTRSSSSRSSTARRCSRCRRAVEGVHVSESDRPLHGRPRRRDAEEPRASQVGASPRGSLALLKLARGARGALGPRLRHAGGREGRRRPGARAPADAEAGAVGAADPRRGRRARGARTVPTPPAEDVLAPAGRRA